MLPVGAIKEAEELWNLIQPGKQKCGLPASKRQKVSASVPEDRLGQKARDRKATLNVLCHFLRLPQDNVQRPGPKSLEELFRWPLRALGCIQAAGRMPVLSHWLETGLDLVTHYSGHGTPEWSMDFIVKAARSKGVRANVFATHSSDMNERCRAVLAHDCPHSLVQSAHVFGALEEHFPPRNMQELQKLQRVVAESGNGVAAAAAVINMARYLRAHRQAGTLLGPNARARCHKCQKDCPVFVDPQTRPVLVAAGTTCVDYSSVGARQGIFGKSISAFLLWVSDVLYRKPTFIVHECTELWRVSILVYFLEGGGMCGLEI